MEAKILSVKLITCSDNKRLILSIYIIMNKVFSLESRRYIGSKFKLIDWIFSHIDNNCEGKIFADLFAGTGVISARAIKEYKHVIINDFLYSNKVIYDAFFGSGKFRPKKIKKYLDLYNSVNAKELAPNYFSRYFGGKYFTRENAKIIGFIREDIEKNKKKVSKREYAILLTSLLYAVDRNANTVGHYDAYIKKPILNKRILLRPINTHKVKKVDIYRQDANALAKKIKADVVYIDPPYNSRQYSRFYHLLETLVKWDKRKLSGVALKPPTENSSRYCTVEAKDAFADLIKNLKCDYIVVSYNNTYNSRSHSSRNKITLEQIEEILNEKGKSMIFKKSHRFFNSGKTNFDNHQEWLFITKTYEKNKH